MAAEYVNNGDKGPEGSIYGVRLRKSTDPLRFFPEITKLDALGNDILGLIYRTTEENRFMRFRIEILDRLIKFTQMIPLNWKTANSVADELTHLWVIMYGSPAT